MPQEEVQAPQEESQPLRSDIEELAEQATEQEINSFLQQAEIHALDKDLAKEERQRVERAKAGHAPQHATESTETPSDAPPTASENAEEAAPPSVNHEQDDLADLDEEELDSFILNDEEVKIKERVWMEFNKDYLEAALAPPTQA